MTITEARKKGFLKDKKVCLKMIPKSNPMTNDPQNPAYGGFDGSLISLTIGSDKSGRLVDPFESDEEREFFESITKQNLSVYTPDNEYWKKYEYKIIKDPLVIRRGIELDLSDPNDALDYKVLLTNKKLICPTMEEYNRFPSPFYDFVFVEEDYEETRVNKEMDLNKKVYMFYGKIEDSPAKMRDFLNVYYVLNMKTNRATESLSKETLQAELGKLIENDRNGVIEVMEDKDYDSKLFILKGVDAGAILKDGFSYSIVGEPRNSKFSFLELVEFISNLKAEKDLLYSKIESQIQSKKK